MKKWKDVIKELGDGKSLDEVTKYIPLAVKVKTKRFPNRISTKQQQAIRRS